MNDIAVDAHSPASAPWLGRLRFDRLVLLPPLITIVLFAAGNHNFGFDPAGWLDAFFYVGYFWHYPEHLAIFRDYYKASRLPWILPGYVSHQLLGEIAASYLLHWATLSSSGVAMYLLVRDTLRDRALAAVVAAAWVCLTPGHGVGGWNYQMIAAAGYYLWGCWLVVRTAASSGAAAAVLGGAALACAIHTHLFFAVFVPLLIPLYAVSRPATGWRWLDLVRALTSAATGALAITVLMAAVNAATGGAWLFFMPQIDYALWISEPGNNLWWFEADRWLYSAMHLVIPLVALAAGAVALLRRSAVRQSIRSVLVLQGWGALAISCYYQFVARQSVLDHDYMAFGLYCHVFPALAVAMQPRRVLPRDRQSIALVTAAVAIIAGALLFLMPTLLPAALSRVAALVDPTVPRPVVPLVAGIAGMMAAMALPGRARLLVGAACFSLLNVWVAPAPRSYGIQTPGIQRSMMRLFREADRFTADLDPTLDRIEYWFRSEPIQTSQGMVDLSAVFDSYASTRGWLGNLLAQKSPPLPVDQIEAEHLAGAVCVGVLSSVERHADIRAEMLARAETVGQRLLPVAGRRFATDDLAFALTVYRIMAVAGTDAASPSTGPPSCRP